ncbi:MAG TPA: glycosyltransferase family 9 protein [Smithellaceae bacterium]|nr:glycosyltransferase family 9 protein [Smithellaceae bacterium]HPL65684.1 glycosyltransferase family 9 protein [Smithellaceae bacterium]
MKETLSTTEETLHLKMNCRRILILRPDNIGDVLLFTGALRHIRNLYPDVHITLAVQPHIVNLVELCPYIDACVPVNHLTWHGKVEHARYPCKHKVGQMIRKMNRLWNALHRPRPFDTIIYPVKSPQQSHLEVIYCLHAYQISGINGCRLNAPGNGYPSKLEPAELFTDRMNVSGIDSCTHELSTTLDFLRFLGCRVTTVDDIRPLFWFADSEKNHLSGIRRNRRKIIGLFPGASMEGKCWQTSNYGKLAKLLGNQLIYVIFGGPMDRILADQVAHSIKALNSNVEILNMAGQMTLRELAKTIMACDLFISMDTSGLHMAIAADVPAIGIIGGGHFNRFLPWGDPNKVTILTKTMKCFHCNWVCTQGDFACIQDVTPGEVAQAGIKLLTGTDSRHERQFADDQCNYTGL